MIMEFVLVRFYEIFLIFVERLLIVFFVFVILRILIIEFVFENVWDKLFVSCV